MNDQVVFAHDLASVISNNRTTIIDYWSDLIENIWVSSPFADWTLSHRKKSLSTFLQIICEILEADALGEKHKEFFGRLVGDCVKHGFDLSQALLMFELAKTPISSQAWDVYLDQPQKMAEITEELDRAIRLFTTAYTRAYVIEANQRLSEEVERCVILEERQRIANEFHDILAPSLSVIKMKIGQLHGLMKQPEIQKVHAILNEMDEIAGESYINIREAIFNLRLGDTSDIDFLSMLQTYLSRYWICYGIKTNLEISEGVSLELNPLEEVQVFRIIQEAITNIRKHAQVTESCIIIRNQEDVLQIIIRDKGIGFDPVLIPQQDNQGVGLHVMKDRAKSIRATVEVLSVPGRGTQVIIECPKKQVLPEFEV